jgi:hypothetical protein
MDIIFRLRDNSKIDELKEYGEIIYISKYTDVVGMSTTKENMYKISLLDYVYYCEKADTGRLLEIAKV